MSKPNSISGDRDPRLAKLLRLQQARHRAGHAFFRVVRIGELADCFLDREDEITSLRQDARGEDYMSYVLGGIVSEMVLNDEWFAPFEDPAKDIKTARMLLKRNPTWREGRSEESAFLHYLQYTRIWLSPYKKAVEDIASRLLAEHVVPAQKVVEIIEGDDQPPAAP